MLMKSQGKFCLEIFFDAYPKIKRNGKHFYIMLRSTEDWKVEETFTTNKQSFTQQTTLHHFQLYLRCLLVNER